LTQANFTNGDWRSPQQGGMNGRTPHAGKVSFETIRLYGGYTPAKEKKRIIHLCRNRMKQMSPNDIAVKSGSWLLSLLQNKGLRHYPIKSIQTLD
jgi:hypothetical protein